MSDRRLHCRMPAEESTLLKVAHTRNVGHLWAFFLPVYFFAAALDSGEITNREYLRFIIETRAAPPEHWVGGRYPQGKDDDPVVLVNFHEVADYCRWAGKRLPTLDEWKSACESGRLGKRGDIWEWTSTEMDMAGQTYKALCGPRDSCDCSHRYLPEWRNEVKGFRCIRDSTPVTWLSAPAEDFIGRQNCRHRWA